MKKRSRATLDRWLSTPAAEHPTSPQAESDVACPVCAIQVPLAGINAHLDGCASHSSAALAKPATPAAAEAAAAAMPGAGATTEAATPPERKRLRAVRGSPARVLRKRPGGRWEPAVDGFGPVDVLHDVLPAAQAEDLARILHVEARARWTTSTWTLFKNEGGTNRLSAGYVLDGSRPPASDELEEGLSRSGEPPHALLEAATAMRDIVRRAHGARAAREAVAPRDAKHAAAWRPTYVFCNYYRDGSDRLGFHSDNLSRLGPRPIIAALSLGAAREFRWQRKDRPAETFAAKLPHNSALIMWAPMQELWKHGVAKQSNETLVAHPLTGLARISLTFRMARRGVRERAPECGCRRVASLGYSIKSSRYYFKCNPNGKGSCAFFEWAKDVV